MAAPVQDPWESATPITVQATPATPAAADPWERATPIGGAGTGLFQPPPRVTNPNAGPLPAGDPNSFLTKYGGKIGESLLDIAGLVAPIAGGIKGAKAGAQMVREGAHWVPKLVATMAGGGAGTVIGGSIDRNLISSPPPPPVTSLTDLVAGRTPVPAAPGNTLGQEATAMATDFATGAAGEAIVPGLVGAYRGLKTIPARLISGAAQRTSTTATREAAGFLGGIGAQPTPAQVGQSNWLRLMENVIEGSPTSRGAYRDILQAQEDAFARRVDSILAEYGPEVTQSEAGQVLKDAKLGEAVTNLQRGEAAATRRAGEVVGAPPPAVDVSPVGRRLGPGMGPERTQQFGQRLLTAANDAATEAANNRYTSLWRAADEAGVTADPTALYTRAQQLLDATGELGVSTGVLGRAKPALKALTDGGDEATDALMDIPGASYLRNLVEAGGPDAARAQGALAELATTLDGGAGSTLPTELSAKQLDRLRSFYGRMASTLEGPARGNFAQLAKAAETSLEDALGGAEGVLTKEWRATQAQYRTMKETFEEGALARAAEANPKEFLGWVLGNKTGSVTDVIRARDVLESAEPGAWQQVQAEAWRGISQLPDGTPRQPGQLLSQLRKYSEEHLRAIFGGHADTLLALKPGLDAVARASKVGATPPTVDKALTGAVTAAQQLNPYTLVSKSLNTASGDDILKLRTLVGDDGWRKVQRLKMQEWFAAGADPTSAVTGSQLFKRLPPMEQLREIVGQPRADYLYQFARVRETLAKATGGSGQGKMWIQLQTPGAATGIVSGILTGNPRLVGAGATVLLTPRLLANIALSPEMGRALIAGMSATAKHEPGTAMHFAGQLAAQLLRAGYIDPDGQERDGAATSLGAPRGVGPGPVGAPPPQLRGQGAGRAGGPGTAGPPPVPSAGLVGAPPPGVR